MRQGRTVQANIFDLFATHEIGRELKAMSQWLDERRDLLGLVARDLVRVGVKATGRQGLPTEAVLRCALLKQYRQLSHQELAFIWRTRRRSGPLRALPWSWSPQKSVLQKTIGAIRPETWEQIDRTLLSNAQQTKLEDGSVVRAGQHCNLSTHARAERQQPAVGCCAGHGAPAEVGGAGLAWRDHCRAARKRAHKIQFTRGRPNRVQLYRTDRDRLRDLGISEAGDRTICRGEHSAHRTVAGQGSSLSTADRTHHQTERAAGVGRRSRRRPARR